MHTNIELYKDIADAAGVDPALILLVVGLSNKKGLLFRGVRSEDEWRTHTVTGIKANGGDGQASFWTTGTRIFSASDEHFQDYDTTFFHYAPGKKGTIPRMYIAGTKASKVGVDHEQDSLNRVYRDLSVGEFARLEVVGTHFGGYESLYPIMISHLINYCNS